MKENLKIAYLLKYFIALDNFNQFLLLFGYYWNTTHISFHHVVYYTISKIFKAKDFQNNKQVDKKEKFNLVNIYVDILYNFKEYFIV